MDSDPVWAASGANASVMVTNEQLSKNSRLINSPDCDPPSSQAGQYGWSPGQASVQSPYINIEYLE